MMTTNGTSIGKWADAVPAAYYVLIIDFEGRMSFTNSHFYNHFRSAAPTVSQLFDLVHDNDRQQLSKTLASCSLRDEAVTTELRISNGRYRWVEWEISRIRKPEIMADKFLCLGYEIAAAEQQKSNVRAFEQYYHPDNALFHSFMDYAPGFNWIVDEQDILMFANQPFLEYFGLDTTVFGKALDEILPGFIAGSLREQHQLVSGNDSHHYGRIILPMADGTEQAYRLSVFPIRYAGSGRMIGGQALGGLSCSSISTPPGDIQYRE